LILDARKPLFFQMFHRFEPQRSNPVKQLSWNGLARLAQKCNIRFRNKPAQMEFMGISTVRGDW
jgi:hypothetical protein